MIAVITFAVSIILATLPNNSEYTVQQTYSVEGEKAVASTVDIAQTEFPEIYELPEISVVADWYIDHSENLSEVDMNN